jgi:chromosome segregation ATPase
MRNVTVSLDDKDVEWLKAKQNKSAVVRYAIRLVKNEEGVMDTGQEMESTRRDISKRKAEIYTMVADVDDLEAKIEELKNINVKAAARLFQLGEKLKAEQELEKKLQEPSPEDANPPEDKYVGGQ